MDLTSALTVCLAALEQGGFTALHFVSDEALSVDFALILCDSVQPQEMSFSCVSVFIHNLGSLLMRNSCNDVGEPYRQVMEKQ